mmetsp:Transcript_12240/g.30828  ORF Transcript_12240/g.30828 Transcript_12240/m.30828 type:complete len:224 (+) Transcript_12240:752-1423(+)
MARRLSSTPCTDSSGFAWIIQPPSADPSYSQVALSRMSPGSAREPGDADGSYAGRRAGPESGSATGRGASVWVEREACTVAVEGTTLVNCGAPVHEKAECPAGAQCPPPDQLNGEWPGGESPGAHRASAPGGSPRAPGLPWPAHGSPRSRRLPCPAHGTPRSRWLPCPACGSRWLPCPIAILLLVQAARSPALQRSVSGNGVVVAVGSTPRRTAPPPPPSRQL